MEISCYGISQYLRVTFLVPQIAIKGIKVPRKEDSDNSKGINNKETEDSMYHDVKEKEEQVTK